MSGDFWCTPGYSPQPISFFTICKRVTIQCAIISKALCQRSFTLRIVASNVACDLLQSDVRRLESWQHYWQMEFIPSKSKIVTISHKNNPPQRTYVFCGVEFKQVDSFPYLGVTISNKLKWSAHVSMTAAKANKSVGKIQCNL